VSVGQARGPVPGERTFGLCWRRGSRGRTILALEKVGLVECLTPDERLGRFYRMTGTGKKVVAIIEGEGE